MERKGDDAPEYFWSTFSKLSKLANRRDYARLLPRIFYAPLQRVWGIITSIFKKEKV
jgi:hypothetical protein